MCWVSLNFGVFKSLGDAKFSASSVLGFSCFAQPNLHSKPIIILLFHLFLGHIDGIFLLISANTYPQ